MADTQQDDVAQQDSEIEDNNSLESFAESFISDLRSVYEYDATEIRDFLIAFNHPHDTLKFVALSSLRQTLFESLCSNFPSVSTKQMYSRRKTETLANDIYILGYCVVNNSEDSRLSKIFKNNNTEASTDTNPELNAQVTESDTFNTAELVDTCLDLRRSVKDLTDVVRNLQTEIRGLQQQIIQSEQLNARTRSTESEERISTGPPQQNDHQSQFANPQIETQEPAPSTSHAATVHSIPPGSNVNDKSPMQSPPHSRNNDDESESVNANSPTQAPPKRSNSVAELVTAPGITKNKIPPSQFTLPKDQRAKIKEGRAFNGSHRQEVTGTGAQLSSIEGIDSDSNAIDSLKSIYVGRLSSKTTTDSLNRHLREQGINQISDIIDLKCRTPGQSSFCIVADNTITEEAIYNARIWPIGAKIRPFKKKNDSRINHAGNQRGNQRGPRHQPWHNSNKNSGSHTKSVNRTIHNPPAPSEPITTGAKPTPLMKASPQNPASPPNAWPPLPQRQIFPFPPMFYDPYGANRFSPLTWQSNVY